MKYQLNKKNTHHKYQTLKYRKTYKDSTDRYKTQLRKIKGLNKWGYSWIGRLNIVKVFILPTIIYKFNAIPIKIPLGFSLKTVKLTLKITWKLQRTKNNPGNLEEQTWRTKTIRYLDYYVTTVTGLYGNGAKIE